MKSFTVFFQMELKRMLRLLIQICIMTFLFAGAAFLFLRGYLMDGEEKEKQKLIIGVTAEEGDLQFVELGVSLLQNMDQTKYSVAFEMITKEQGEEKIINGELDAWIMMPPNYVHDVYYGQEEPIALRFGKSQTGVSSLLIRQLADSISEMMMDSKAGVYAMQDMYSDWSLQYHKDGDLLSQEYIVKILGRENFFERESVRATEELTTEIYYFCVGMLMLFLLWGLNCGAIFGGDNYLLEQMLLRRGLSSVKQSLAKFCSLLILFVFNFFLAAAGAAIIFCVTGVRLTELENKTITDWISCFIKLLAVFPMICAMALLVYEKTKDAIGGSLFFFFMVIALSFLSGCFYPLSYFPMWMQKLAEFLPIRVLFRYIAVCITGKECIVEFMHVLIYTVIFMLLANTNNIWQSCENILFNIKFSYERDSIR